MLNYTRLFADLEELFRSAGRDPASFRRFAREVDRVRGTLAEYYTEVATDYVIRLEQRLSQPGARLTSEEITLLRAYLELPPDDPERARWLLEDLAELEETLKKVLALKDSPLSMKNLDGLRKLLERLNALLPRIVHTLEERHAARRFEEAVAGGGEWDELDREWLLGAIRRALEGSDQAASQMSSEESTMPFGG